MSASSISIDRLTRWPLVAAAQCWHRLGGPGCAGLMLCLASTGLAYPIYQLQRHSSDTLPKSTPHAISDQQVAAPSLPRPRLPASSDAPLVLRQLQQASQDAGLGWSQADYRVNPLTDEGLATLEVRTTLKGPYPALRKWITTVLDSQPALALRELTMTRPNSDTLEVEAKITLAVFLSDGWPIAEPPEWPALEPAEPGGGKGTQPANQGIEVHALPALSPRSSANPANAKGARP